MTANNATPFRMFYRSSKRHATSGRLHFVWDAYTTPSSVRSSRRPVGISL